MTDDPELLELEEKERKARAQFDRLYYGLADPVAVEAAREICLQAARALRDYKASRR